MGYTILVNFQLMGIWVKRNIACGLFIIFGKISELRMIYYFTQDFIVSYVAEMIGESSHI